jgi:hypothetical protein
MSSRTPPSLGNKMLIRVHYDVGTVRLAPPTKTEVKYGHMHHEMIDEQSLTDEPAWCKKQEVINEHI